MGKKMDLMGDLRSISQGNRDYFDALCAQRGAELYYLYHSKFPELKSASTYYSDLAYRDGSVLNLYGRRRHLDPEFCYRAFNTVNQSTAADIMKERLVALCNVLPPEIKPLLCVHDEILLSVPIDMFHIDTVNWIVGILEQPDCSSLTIPIRCSVGWSDQNWASCNQEWKTVL